MSSAHNITLDHKLTKVLCQKSVTKASSFFIKQAFTLQRRCIATLKSKALVLVQLDANLFTFLLQFSVLCAPKLLSSLATRDPLPKNRGLVKCLAVQDWLLPFLQILDLILHCSSTAQIVCVARWKDMLFVSCFFFGSLVIHSLDNFVRE